MQQGFLTKTLHKELAYKIDERNHLLDELHSQGTLERFGAYRRKFNNLMQHF